MSDIKDVGQRNKLDELKKQEAEELAEMLSKKYNLPYIDLSVVSINTDALRLIPETDARAAGIAAFKIIAKKISVVIATPNNPKIAEILGHFKEQQYEVVEYMSSFASLERAWERYK